MTNHIYSVEQIDPPMNRISYIASLLMHTLNPVDIKNNFRDKCATLSNHFEKLMLMLLY